MKTYDERIQEVLKKIGKKRCKRFRIIRSTVAICCIAALALVLFMPYSFGPPSVAQYRGSEYYDLIQKINLATYQPPKYNNNFEKWTAEPNRIDVWMGLAGVGSVPQPNGTLNVEGSSGGEPDGGNYVEVTDNQTAGVIEGDLIKRTEDHIFYLRDNYLMAFSIAQDRSYNVGSFEIRTDNCISMEAKEMYLSADGTTVTVMLSCFGRILEEQAEETVLCILNLDVSDPKNIQESGRIYISGKYSSSRLVDGKLMVVSQFQIREEYDFSQPETFVPQIGVPGNMQPVAAEDIITSDVLNNTFYTMVTLLDQKNLQEADTAALLSYSDQIYVSEKNIFLTGLYNRSWQHNGASGRETATAITALRHADGTLEYLGGTEVAGSVKNQYSMDEKDGILRVVTSTTRTNDLESSKAVPGIVTPSSRNADLYCIDLETWSIAAKVESFAPEGEEVESVRFDGDAAYVCTAEVITLTDPVYFFDLSDLENITWKDTGTIDGYSSSLVNFGNGYLVGIGYGRGRTLKIEVYEEREDSVVSLAAYERDYGFSEDYKAYLIDRENQLVGLGISGYDEEGNRLNGYLLLLFDGYEFRELVKVSLPGRNNLKRAVLIDGWLYMFANEHYGFRVEQIW